MFNPVQYKPIAYKTCFGSPKFLLSLNDVIPRTPPTPNLCFLVKCNPPILSAQCCTSPHDQRLFTVSYLEDTCGFSPETALSLSKYLTFKTSRNADAVWTLIRSCGFSGYQIRQIVRRIPEILQSNPEKTILPKFEFLRSKGFSNSELVEAVTSSPYILLRSLENHIISTFESIENIFQSDEKALSFIKRWPCLISFYNMKGNVQVLLDSGVPKLYVCKLLEGRPLLFLRKSSDFKGKVEKVKKLGFNPSSSFFLTAFTALNCKTEKWERRVEIFKKWGWTEDDVLVAFRRCPHMMMISDAKIMAIMNFLVNQMGCDSMQVVRRPGVLQKSLEERIIPRSRVVLYLYSKGLIRKNCSLITPLIFSETHFLQHYIGRFKEEASHLMNLYGEQDKMDEKVQEVFSREN